MKHISVDVAALAEAFSMRGLDAESWLDTETGLIHLVQHECMTRAELEEDDPTMSDWMRAEIVRAREVQASPGRYLLIEADDNRSEWRDMERFIDSVQDTTAARQMGKAIDGRGAFRRFKDEDDELDLLDSWYTFAESCVRERALDWLASKGFAPLDG